MKKFGLLFATVFASINALTAQTTKTVLVSDYLFTPKDLNITLGDAVKWEWVSGMHTTTSDSTIGPDVWNAPIDVNDTVLLYAIKTPGIHSYHCNFQVSIVMVGSIIATSPTEVQDNSIMAGIFRLEQNYLNPFNPGTKIRYSVPQLSMVTIKIFDVLENEIETLLNKEEPACTYTRTWNAENLLGEVYFYQIRAKDYAQTKKMTLLK